MRPLRLLDLMMLWLERLAKLCRERALSDLALGGREVVLEQVEIFGGERPTVQLDEFLAAHRPLCSLKRKQQ